MPYQAISQFKRSFPAIRKLTPHQQRIAFEVFKSSIERGDDDGTAIAKAIATARRGKLSEDMDERRVLSLAEINISEGQLSETEFQVLRTGEFYDRRYGQFRITDQILQDIKRNFDENVLGIDVALDTNHEPDKGAKAWISSLEVRDGGLWAKFKDFTNEAQQFFREKIYRYFSVEYGSFEKVENGKKVTIRNVLRGIALTNRPVIKGMQPTFLSEQAKSFLTLKTTHMSAIKVLGERLLQRDKLAKQDADDFKTAFAALSEDEQAEAQEVADQVEAKAEADAAAEAEAEKAKAEAEGAEGEGADDAETPEGVEAAELAETKKALEAKDKELAEFRKREDERALSEFVTSVTLSMDNLTGFSEAVKDEVQAFAEGLDQDQREKFAEIVKKVQTVDTEFFSESGSGKQGVEPGDEDTQLSEIATLAESYQKEGMAPHDAIAKAQKEVLNK